MLVKHKKINELEGYSLALLASFCYGSSGIFGRMLYRYESDPLTVVALQGTVATALIFLGVFFFRRQVFMTPKSDIYFFVFYGFLGMFSTPLCFFYAIKYTTVATAAILISTAPALVVLFSVFLLNEPLTRRKVKSLLLCFAGTFLVIQCYRPELLVLNLKGILFGFGGSLCMTFFTIFGKRAVKKHAPWTIVFYGMLFGTVFLIVFRLFQGAWYFHYPSPMWMWLLLTAFIPIILAEICYLSSLHHLEAGKVSIILSFQVVVAPLLAFLFLQESLELLQMLGAGLVLAGILLLQRPQRYK